MSDDAPVYIYIKFGSVSVVQEDLKFLSSRGRTWCTRDGIHGVGHPMQTVHHL